MSDSNDNPYLCMDMAKVRADARAGVALARAAWRKREPESAVKELGKIIEPGVGHRTDRTRRILAAVGGYQHRRKGRDAPDVLSGKQE